jgi:hypothetical protein
MPADEEEVPIQNQVRELQLAALFGLIPTRRRLGVDAHDEHGNEYELKSTTKGGVGTGRDVSIAMLEAWQRRYWIVGKGKNLRSGFVFDELYFLAPAMICDRLTEIADKIKPDLELRDLVVPLLKGRLTETQLERLHYLISRGATLNNPKISWKYIQTKGIKIEGNPRERLRRLIRQYPLTSAR